LQRSYIVSRPGHAGTGLVEYPPGAKHRLEPAGELPFRKWLARHRQHWRASPARLQCVSPPAELPRAEQRDAFAWWSV